MKHTYCLVGDFVSWPTFKEYHATQQQRGDVVSLVARRKGAPKDALYQFNFWPRQTVHPATRVVSLQVVGSLQMVEIHHPHRGTPFFRFEE